MERLKQTSFDVLKAEKTELQQEHEQAFVSGTSLNFVEKSNANDSLSANDLAEKKTRAMAWSFVRNS